ncbi:sensor histidine kinase [Spirillospora sp. NPDC047279]|uniref:sensor histidine kinase n=1 Tax=Spirillospora sp. NPDC047279 TaxID=3155478 RepID=UPI0033FE9A9A
MSTSEPHRPRWPRPSEWPVWVVPLLILPFQIMGSLGVQRGREGHGPPWMQDQQGPHFEGTTLNVLGFALLVAGPALLLLRRRYPRETLLGVGAVTAAYALAAFPLGPIFLSLCVAMVAAVVGGHRLLAWAGTFGTLAGLLLVAWMLGDDPLPVDEPTMESSVMVVAWALVVLTGAELVRMRSAQLAERARTRAEEARRQASEERLRMARELHDVLAHNISMINVQAGVALHLMDDDPRQARTALAAIKEASKEALTEMRSVIGALRSEGESAPRSPTAGMARLEELLDRARNAGLPVTSKVEGEPRPLPAGTDLAAYRIVQESLTNVGRHAGSGPVTAEVRIAYGEHEISVRIDDDGRGVSLLDDHAGGTGSGIRGMRERAAALGGTFSAGPRPGGGYRVEATLPIADEPGRDAQ